jgi:hypothetical protein
MFILLLLCFSSSKNKTGMKCEKCGSVCALCKKNVRASTFFCFNLGNNYLDHVVMSLYLYLLMLSSYSLLICLMYFFIKFVHSSLSFFLSFIVCADCSMFC